MGTFLFIFALIYFPVLALLVRESLRYNRRDLKRWRFVVLLILWPVFVTHLGFELVRYLVKHRR